MFLLIVGQAFAQLTDQQLERNKLYKDYTNMKDTMTSRTWINMVNLSNKLEAIVLFDNAMIDSLSVKAPGQENLEARIQELSKLREELVINNARLNETYARSENTRKSYFIMIIILGASFLTLLVFFLIVFTRYRKMMVDTVDSNQKILELKHQHKQEIDDLKDLIEVYEGEKEMLENNAQEMKKSFEIMKSEQMRRSDESSSTSTSEIDEIRKEMEELSNEIARVMEERDEFEESLGMANLKLAHQIDLNKKFEADLESLLSRMKVKPKTDQD